MEIFQESFLQILPAFLAAGSLSEEIEVAVITFLGVTILLLSVGGAIIVAAVYSGGVLKGIYKFTTNAAKSAAGAIGGLGKQAAKESKYGQAYQMYRGRQKAATSERARGLIRGKRIFGGGREAERLTAAEERKHRVENEGNLSKSITSPLGKMIAQGVNLNRPEADGSYNVRENGKDRKIRLTDTDRGAIAQLRQQGYVDSNGNFSGDPHLTNAALQSLMAYEDISTDDVRGLARRTGSSIEENAYFAQNLRGLAAEHKYSNLKYSDVSGGQLTSYSIRGQDSPDVADGSTSATGAMAMVSKGGLANANKDIFKDSVVQTAMTSYISSQTNPDARKQAALKVITDASHITDSGVRETIMKQVQAGIGGAGVLSDADFNAAFNSVKSNGAIPLPAFFGGAAPAAPAPAPAPLPPAAPAAPPPLPSYDPTRERKPPPPGTDRFGPSGPGGLWVPPDK